MSEATEQNTITIPRIGDKAPAFHAATTQGNINFPKDYEGRWVIFFSHPADFSPVCTTELMSFAGMENQFEMLNCELLGLSVDGIYSHIAWLRTIQEKIEYQGIKNALIQFPLIEDSDRSIANLYGMIQPGEDSNKAVRAVFIIDPHGIIRSVLYYPVNVGRNINEIYRLLVALQCSDKFSVATPANWQVGQEVVLAPSGSCDRVQMRMDNHDEEVQCYDWFFCTKTIEENEIWSRLCKKESVSG